MQEPCQRTIILNVTISCIDDSLCCDVHCNKFDLTDGSVQDVFKIDADFQNPRLLKSGDKATAVYSKCIQGYTFRLASNSSYGASQNLSKGEKEERKTYLVKMRVRQIITRKRGIIITLCLTWTTTNTMDRNDLFRAVSNKGWKGKEMKWKVKVWPCGVWTEVSG